MSRHAGCERGDFSAGNASGETEFYGTATVTQTNSCGAEKEQCCNDGNGNTSCDEHLACSRTETCVPCGNFGEIPCDGGCNGDLMPMNMNHKVICTNRAD